MNILVDGVGVVAQLCVAVAAEQQISKDTFLPIMRFRCTAFRLGNASLHLLKVLSGNNRLVNILEDHPILWVVIIPPFILEGLGIGLEIDNIAAVFLLREDFLHCGLAPPVRIRLRLFAASRKPLALPIGHWDEDFLFLQNAGNGLIAFPIETHLENAFYDLRRFRVDDPLLFVFRALLIPVRRLG